MALSGGPQASAIDISFEGQSRQVISVPAEKQSGLNHIFVAYDSSEISRMVISGLNGPLTAQRYSNLGGGFAEDVPVVNDGGVAYIDCPAGDMGYILTDGDRPVYIWLVNYLPHRLRLVSAEAAPEQDCDNTRIMVNGSGDPIHYYSIDGRRMELNRAIELEYYTLEWDSDAENFKQVTQTKSFSSLVNPLVVTPPFYCNTEVSVSGDAFLREWGMGETCRSGLVHANGIAAQTTAVQTNASDPDSDEPSNVIRGDEGAGMGGSAPAEISFKAYVTDALIHNEWQIASDENFDYIDYRFNQQDLDYTFMDEGRYYVRFVGSNSDGTCEVFGDVYNVSIGASELKVPNAFSPNDDGVNDVWKVSYRSLTKFRCTIFDRYGNEIYSFDDPDRGWDGKYKGKAVKAGVYYYVIEAHGADGKKYKKGGDINIIEFRRNSNTGTTPTE